MVRTRYFPLIGAGVPTFMGLPLATTPAELKGADAVILGAPYVASWEEYAGVPKSDWIAAPKRVRQQSIRYPSGYLQDFDLDIFEYLRVVDYGDAVIPAEVYDNSNAENGIRRHAAVETNVQHVLVAGAMPVGI